MGWLCPVLHCAGWMDGAGGVLPLLGPPTITAVLNPSAPGWSRVGSAVLTAEVGGPGPQAAASAVLRQDLAWEMGSGCSSCCTHKPGWGSWCQPFMRPQCRDWGRWFLHSWPFITRPLLPLWQTALPAKGPCLLGLICSVPAPCLVSCFLLGITLMPLIGLF